jgi:hypothetical protein
VAKDLSTSFNDPKMLAILKEINEVKADLEQAGAEEDKADLKKRITELQMHYDILSERRGPG